MIKKCIICGRDFKSPPSDKKVTCSKDCQKKQAKINATGRIFPEATRRKMKESAHKPSKELQQKATEAAKKSPISGRFKTNRNAKDWHLISPEGEHFYFHSLSFWLRENGKTFFGCEPDSREFQNVRSGIGGAKRAMMGKKYNCTTYKGWKVIPVERK